MILTCPECATRYSVADDSVGPEGRTVRCANCGLTWRAEREGALELQPAPAVAPPPAVEDLPKAFRERIAAQQTGRKRAQSGLVWGAGIAAGLALVAGLTLGREGVVQAWPKTASAYAALGLPVNSVGLIIEEQTAQVGWAEGRPTVMVSGRLKNVRSRPVTSPPLRFTLLDGEDKDLGTRVSTVANPEVPAGGARSFTVMLQNPPESVVNVEIGFELSEAGDHGAGSKNEAHGPDPGSDAEAPSPSKTPTGAHDEAEH
jgi:predicted Zn finger-like uncharacterized protein